MLRFGRSRAAAWAPGSRWTIASAALGAALLLGAPARAQLFAPEPWGMPPGAIQRVIASQGFHVLVAPYRNGPVYVADVVNARGVQQRLIVDAYRGTIMQTYDVAQAQPRRRAYALPWPDSDQPWPPAPPPAFGDSDPDWAPPRPLAPIGRPYGDDQPDLPGPRTLQRTVRGQPDDARDPAVIPGIGPASPVETQPPRPKRQAKPKTPVTTVRATPLPPVGAAASAEPGSTTPPVAPGGQTHAAPVTHPPASETGRAEPGPGPGPAPAGTVAAAPSAKPAAVAAPAATAAAAPAVKPVVPGKKKPEGTLNDVPAAPLD